MTNVLPAPKTTDGEASTRPAVPFMAVLGRARDLALIPPIILIVIIGAIVSPNFLTKGNLTDVLVSMSWVALLVLAEGMVLLTGKMDLSLESTVGLAPGIAAWLTLPKGINHGLHLVSPSLAIPIALLVGLAVGVINGFLVVGLGLNAFIVTLGGLITLRGLLTGISGGQTFFGSGKDVASLNYLGTANWFGQPAAVWIIVLAYALAIVGLRYLRVGRSLYAIGGNPDAARAAGIQTNRTIFLTLVLASVLAALAGIMLSGHLASVASQQGNGAIFTVFAAAVIGGVSLNGGKGTMFGAFTGVLLLFLVQNVLTFAGVSGEWFQFLDGAVIIAVLVVSRLVGGRASD